MLWDEVSSVWAELTTNVVSTGPVVLYRRLLEGDGLVDWELGWT